MRERAGLNQQEVADALEVTKRRYGGWEREEREINLRDAIRLADLFHCSLDELAGREWMEQLERRGILSPEEQRLLDAYRASDRRGQGNIMDTAGREKIASRADVGADRRRA